MARDAPDSGSQSTSQKLHTQAPFGTQFQPPTRAYSDSDDSPKPGELQRLGTNRLDPVTIANRDIGCIDIHPEQGATQYERLQQVLKEVHLPKKRAVRQAPRPHVNGWIMDSFAGPKPTSDPNFFNEENLRPENLGPDVQDIAPPPWELEGWEESIKEEPQSPKSVEQSGKEALSRASRDSEATDSAEGQNDSDTYNGPEENTASSPECSWMKGFIFNSKTLKVSKLQQQCLTKDTSWLHPPPGRPPFQDGNMPQSILAALHRIADERAGAEDDETGNSDSDIDPSPDSLPVGVNLSAESVPQTTQENDESDEEGMVSQWSASPESPQRPLRPHQGLPPDSSPVIQKLSAEQPSGTLPKASVKQPQHPEIIELSEDEPLAIQTLAISDDEMDMEECIPQALGEDLLEKTGPRRDIPAVSTPKPTQPQSVVQVKETPYGKGKAAQRTDSISLRRPVSKQTPNSNGESKKKGPTNQRDTSRTDPKTVDQARRESQGEMAGTGAGRTSEDAEMADGLLETEETADLPGATPKPLSSQGLPPGSYPNMPQDASRSTKRKLLVSPTRGNRVKSKRRQISIVGFGDIPLPPVDPHTQLRKDRAESFRRFQEQRHLGTSFERLHEPTRAPIDNQGRDATDLDSVDMLGNEQQSDTGSPQHESLYEEPSPRPVGYNGPVQSLPLHRKSQLRGQPRSSQAEHRSTPSSQTQYVSAVSDEESYETVFETFKAAYPEYKGNMIHFNKLCTDIHKLDLEDKMVPRWQWDDFIIRDRTDYRDYVNECYEHSEYIKPYHRFYKDHICDTLYRRGIVKDRQTLEQALEELSIALNDEDAPGQPPMGPPPRPLPSRKSLPGSFDRMRQPRDSSVAASHVRPRQSLPASSYVQQHYRQDTPSASRSHTPREQPRTRPSRPARTGDPFIDFYNEYQWGGKNEVGRSNPRLRSEESRSSVADVPSPKVDVLQRSDLL